MVCLQAATQKDGTGIGNVRLAGGSMARSRRGWGVFAVIAGLAGLAVGACSADTDDPFRPSGQGPSGTAQSSSGSGGGSATGATGAGGGTNECATDVPCAATSDCVALAGTRCNEALDAPRCQTVQCAGEGAPCSDTALCATDLYCVDYESFGVFNAELRGVCMTDAARREVCIGRCKETPPSDPSWTCTNTMKQAACEYACATYPDGWEDQCDNLFQFLHLNCAPNHCELRMECINEVVFDPPQCF